MSTTNSPQSGFTTREISLAAYLKTLGHQPTILPPSDPTEYFAFAFQGDPQQLQELAEEYATGGLIPAFRFYETVNSLKGEIRLQKGGWK